jgi:hypothetical protein
MRFPRANRLVADPDRVFGSDDIISLVASDALGGRGAPAGQRKEAIGPGASSVRIVDDSRPRW